MDRGKKNDDIEKLVETEQQDIEVENQFREQMKGSKTLLKKKKKRNQRGKRRKRRRSQGRVRRID